VEVSTWYGLVTYYVLVMELSTRRDEIAGITPHPTAAFMQQCARQLTDHFDGFLLDKRYLIHDRDSKFTVAFDQYLRDSGIEHIPSHLVVRRFRIILVAPRGEDLQVEYPV
jgi:putative transposase